MTNQQIFDRVLTHLRAQGCAAAIAYCADEDLQDKQYDCRYRLAKGDTTLMCAAGCLIPDDLYNPNLEGFRATSSEVAPVLAKALGIARDNSRTWQLIGDLQQAHDGALAAGEPLKWERRMAQIAGDYGLTYTQLTVVQERFGFK